MPSTDGVSTSVKTYQITSRTLRSDSVLANTNNSYLGRIVDPETRSLTTCNFLAQFSVLEDTKYPARSQMLDDNGELMIDSCAVRIFISDYIGDSLATLKLTAQELDTNKVVQENMSLYTNLDASEFLTEGKGVKTTMSYSVKDLSRPDSVTSSSKNIVVRLPKEYGKYLTEKYFENPSNYKNSYEFIRHVCPGFYFQIKGGVGSMVHASTSTLDVFFRYRTTEDGKDTIVSAMQRAAATEEVIQQTLADNNIPSSMLSADSAFTYLKSPAGLFTELTLPMDEILAGEHYTDTINSASLILSALNAVSQSTQLTLTPPTYVVLLRKSETYRFFETSQATNSATSYLASYDTDNKAYSFSNISRLLTTLKDERDRLSGVTLSDDQATREAKWRRYEEENPEWNKIVLVPGAAVTSTTYNSSGYTTTTIVGVKNELGMHSVRIKGGADGLINLDVTYSHFNK